jgi:hypothetical protein
MQEHWFKVDLQFVCPSCSGVSAETIIARARNKDSAAIAIVEQVTLECQKCKAICLESVDFRLSMKDLTPEELANFQVGACNSFPVAM